MWWCIVVGYLTLWNCHLLVLGQTTDDKPKIEFLQIQSDIKFRFATTLVTSRMVNPSSTAKEAKFEVTLPDEAFISDFVMEIGGRLYPGEINEKEVAKKKYDTAKKKGQSAGHVSQKPRAANRFSVDVNVGAQEKVTFNLTYQELLHRSQGTYEHVIYIDPGQIVPELRIDVSILESRDITNVMVPPLRNDLLMTESLKGRNSLALIERPTQKSARITYFPSEADQRAKSDQGISGLFVVEYDIEREADAGDVMVVNGYFVHFFAPSDMDPIPKDALFILDVSGSMSGKKIAQVKDAMIKILDELQVGDRFNIMEFSSRVTYWRPGTVVTVDRQTIRAAKSYVRKINSGGMTNINDAMLQGIDFLNGLSNKENRSQIVLFLTDGQPSAGDTNIGRILSNVKSRNDKDVPVYSLAFGAGANYEFVKKVAVQNDGVSRRIFEDSDAALQISGFYDEISAASLKNVTFKYLEDGGSGVSNLTNSRFNSYLSGGELVVAGKMDDNTLQLFDLKVQGLGAKGSIELALTSDLQQPPIPDLTKQADYQKITEKIWAFLTIKELLEKSIGSTDSAEKESLKQEALDLSLKYKFVTPLTSMVVTKPEERDVGDLEDTEDAALLGGNKGPSPPPRTYPSVSRNRAPSGGRGGGGGSGGRGGGGGGGGSYSGGGGGDPHFMIRMRGMELPVCFDVRAEPGSVMRLLQDKNTGLTVNAGIIPSFVTGRNGEQRTYIGEIVILADQVITRITPDRILINGAEISWKDENPFTLNNVTYTVKYWSKRFKILQVAFGDDIRLLVKSRHADINMAVNYLNIYIDKEDGLSKNSEGIIGEFIHDKIALRHVRVNQKGQVVGSLRVIDKSQKVKVKANVRTVLKARNNTITGEPEMCWNAHKSVTGLLQKDTKEYFIKDILLQ